MYIHRQCRVMHSVDCSCYAAVLQHAVLACGCTCVQVDDPCSALHLICHPHVCQLVPKRRSCLTVVGPSSAATSDVAERRGLPALPRRPPGPKCPGVAMASQPCSLHCCCCCRCRLCAATTRHGAVAWSV